MLFFLTGNIQTGKTRWLERTVRALSADGVECVGVLAPGIWREHGLYMRDALREEASSHKAGVFDINASSHKRGVHVNAPQAGQFEKLGINNVLLPDGECVRFAARRDLLEASPSPSQEGAGGHAPSTTSQADSASLGWAVFDDAIEKVNCHFSCLQARFSECLESVSSTERPTSVGQLSSIGQPTSTEPRILIVDEIGRLELRGGGLTSAFSMLMRGQTPTISHALVVVRASLLEEARECFAAAPWGGMCVISPDEAALAQLRRTVSSCL